MSIPELPELPLPTTEGPAPAPIPGGPRLSLRLRDPGDLVAAVPHLIGFRPVDSLVLVAVVPGERSPQVGAVARIDLPDPGDAGELATAVARCARRMGRRAPEEVAVVVVGGGPEAAGPGRGDVVDAVEAMFAATRVPVRTRLWVSRIASGATWRCFPPCDCRGTVPPMEDSEMAMASAVLGQVTYGSRAELEATLAADPAAAGAHRRTLVDRAFASARLDRELGGPAAARRDLEAVRSVLAEVAAGRALGDEELARVAVALCDPKVRDTCIGWSLGPRAAAAEQLWTLLVRGVPEPEVAEPAVLLACAAIARGGGALVGAALERARRADPDHTLTGLIDALLERGLGRQEFTDWVRRSAEESERMLTGGKA